MIQWQTVTIIVPAAVVAEARLIGESLGPKGMGLNMYQTALSPNGKAPATHYASGGAIDAAYVAVLEARNASVIHGLAKQTSPDTTLTLKNVQDVLAQAVMHNAAFLDAVFHMGLQIITTDSA